MKKNEMTDLKVFCRTNGNKRRLLTFLCLLLTSLLFSEVFAQQEVISINQKDKPLSEVLKEIENQSGYSILVRKNDIDTNMKVSISVDKKSVEEILKLLFKGKDISYVINGKSITIYKPQAKQEDSQQKVSGRIMDVNGDPIIGASVAVKGTKEGTATDVGGEFTLSCSRQATLVVSYLGYRTQEVKVNSQKNLIITLEEGSEVLDEVVVVGFGTQKKASVVGAVQTIRPGELKTPSSSLTNSFAGRLAGVISVQRSGEPGNDAASFWIRGISTFSGPTEPLIYIDGVEVTAKELNALSPEVIEGFSVLKDATATALYGARGANGVMLVTTRKGKDMEKSVIHVRLENSITQPTKMVKLSDGVDYMVAYNNAIMNRNPNASPKFSNEKIVGTIRNLDPIVFPNVDWQEEMFNDFASTQSASLNVTGGGKKANYFLNATFNNDNGMFKKDPNNTFDNQMNQFRSSLQGNIEATITPTTKVELRLSTQIVKYTGSASTTNIIYQDIFTAPPVMFPPYYPNTTGEDHILFGNNSNGPINIGEVGIFSNPYARMVQGYRNEFSSNTTASFNVDQDLKFFLKGLRFKALIAFKNYSLTTTYRNFNPYYYEMESYTKLPDGSYDYQLKSLNKGSTALVSTLGSGGDRLINFQTSLEYAQTYDLHDVSAMLIYLQRDYNLNAPSDYYSALPQRNQGIAGRLTYSYAGKYLFETNFGYNGSENFQEGQRFGFFPSVAIGYNISNEDYFEPLKAVVSNLKLRGSYGLVGNSFTNPRFPYLSFINLNGSGFTFGDNFQNTKTGADITKYGADGAHWETGTKINAGIDLLLFDQLSIVADIYQEKRKGIFMQRNILPAEIGIPFDRKPWANLGVVKNQGIDIAVDYNKAFTKDLIVNFRGSFTYSVNKLLERDEMPREFDFQSDLNKPLNVIRGLRAIGLFENQADIDNSPEQTYMSRNLLKPGDIKYADLNGDGKIDDNDMEQLGYPYIPQITYGFGGSVSYKKFDFSIFFQGVAKTSIMMSNIHPFTTNETVLFDFIAQDYWTETNPNPDAAYPRLVSGTVSHNNFVSSSFWLRDGSFLRLKNAEVGYTYKSVRVFVAGQNLITFAPFKYWDPELGGSGANTGNGYLGNGLWYPPLRMYNVGLQLTF